MNFKDKLVSKLLDIGKKHRILVYPMLALVAVVTAISHVICWGRGNGKKMVASIMVVALLITQSLRLIIKQTDCTSWEAMVFTVRVSAHTITALSF